MPRPKTQNSVPQLSAGQASYVLDRLVSDRRVSPGEITRYVSEMHREISDLEQRLQSLRHAAGSAIASALSSVGVKRRGRRPGRPAGSTNAAASTAASTPATGAKRGPGRPPGSGAKRGPGRPRGSANVAAATSGGISGGGAPAAASAAGAKRGRRRKSVITPEQLASRQLQGRYLGLIRQVPASKRAQYQKIAKEKGREAAIRELQDAVKK